MNRLAIATGAMAFLLTMSDNNRSAIRHLFLGADGFRCESVNVTVFGDGSEYRVRANGPFYVDGPNFLLQQARRVMRRIEDEVNTVLMTNRERVGHLSISMEIVYEMRSVMERALL